MNKSVMLKNIKMNLSSIGFYGNMCIDKLWVHPHIELIWFLKYVLVCTRLIMIDIEINICTCIYVYVENDFNFPIQLLTYKMFL